ncbi:hypothetical protein [Caldilinea sp.]|uniref:hypothetical protein n=1 Tax=Caldilinea sp. TaxID=2293560 RepID=UPI0021DE2E59|nr:hypothetical protein [Caldilinea sp.]GIV67818.1 MAG: hypothetical protein KatS3mg048_0680 [Caldilinea sp.]
MSRLETLMQSVRYVTVKDHHFVVLDADDWEALLEWLETIEDLQIFQDALTQLDVAGGDPNQAGWLRWEEVRDQLS